MTGIERLELEVIEMNDNNVSSIFNYLKSRADMIECFNNEEKSINQMYEFIYKKANKLSKNNVAMIQDNVVYLWAITYFKESNKELGLDNKIKPSSTIKNSKKVENKQEDTKQEIQNVSNNQITLFQEVSE